MIEFFKNVWASSPGNKAMLVAAALILLGAIAGVIYARFFYVRDKGFMRTDKGDDIRWEPGMVVSVFFDPELPNKYLTTCNAVIREINAIVERTILLYGSVYELSHTHPIHKVTDVPPDTIYIRLGDNLVDLTQGENEWLYDAQGHLRSSLITIRPDLVEDLLLLVTRHEFGHGLGLDHDEDPASVMAALHRGIQAKDYTDADKQRLRRSYA